MRVPTLPEAAAAICLTRYSLSEENNSVSGAAVFKVQAQGYEVGGHH